ncbi:MAG: lysophospholipid acyltransferase family protein [Spirochaetes bacterium]|nr:lysophospholipid acyltransferase family protein [Spirochaetota bacterium]
MAKSKFTEYAEYIPARIILFFLNLIPYKLSISLGGCFGLFVYIISGSLRRTTINGLNTAYGQTMSVKEKKKLSRRVFKNVGKTIFEFIQFPKLTKEKMLKLVKFENIEAMDRALEKGRGVIGITGHIGNFEMLAASFALTGRPLHAIIRPLDNKLLDVHLNKNMEDKGVHPVPRGTALKLGLKALKKGAVLAFVMDQNAAMHGIFVPFFGKLASTVQGPAILASHYKSPVVFCYAVRNKNNTHTMVFHDEMELEQGKDKEETIYLNTKKFTKEIEKVIAKYPDQWWWLHPRWRKRPEGEKTT